MMQPQESDVLLINLANGIQVQNTHNSLISDYPNLKIKACCNNNNISLFNAINSLAKYM